MSTLVKVGSLAFDVAQDEKIRELATMVHHGGRRRGLWGQSPSTSGVTTSASDGEKSAKSPPAKVTAPAKTAVKTPPRKRIPFEPNPGEPLPWLTDGPIFGVPLGKYATGGNGKTVLHYAGLLGKMLLK